MVSYQLAAQEFRITDLGLGADGRPVLTHTADPSAYYVLYRADSITANWAPKDLHRVASFTGEFRDPDPIAATTYYRIGQIPLTAPLDLDGDGLHDLFELDYRPSLDPLNPADALEDPDHDGCNTACEVTRGTHPFLPDSLPPAAPAFDLPPSATTAGFIPLRGTAATNGWVRIEGGAAVVTNAVAPDGTFELTVPLAANKLNRLFASWVNRAGDTSPARPFDVLQDSQPPTNHVDFPTNGMVLAVAATPVAGRVGDMLSGFRGLAVWVHSSPSEGVPPTATTRFPFDSPLRAEVDVGIGPNGTFERSTVPLAEGTNLLTALATDLLGNRSIRRVEVVRVTPTGARLVAVSGERQMTNVLRRVAEPLVVRVVDANGAPVADRFVQFDVTRSDGRLLPLDPHRLAADWTASPSANTNGAMRLALRTDAGGEARVWWALGSDAGCGNNRVCAAAEGIEHSVFFCASAMGQAARQINVGGGNYQRAEVGNFTPEPLRVWVSDGLNPVAGVPVTFRVAPGGGVLYAVDDAGQVQSENGSSLVVPTRVTGHAEVRLRLGPAAGPNTVEASFPGQAGLPATFTAHGLRREPGVPGSFSGLVLDNTSGPIGGAYCELTVANSTLSTYSDAQGRFRFDHVPGGAGHLYVNGATATTLLTQAIPTNSFPALSYAVLSVPNAANELPTPVRLPRLDPRNAHVYQGTNDLVLTVEGMAGLKMTIRANSMALADGRRVTPANPAVVSLNQVHHDDVPMPMPDGASPPFAWTLQPAGATFSPPIAIEYPNMSGLAPGSIAYFLSFNHDTERFEIVSSGHVSEDGAIIRTDPHSGLTLAGWGCNCPPYSATSDVEECTPPEPSANGCGAEAMGGGNPLTNCGVVSPQLAPGLPLNELVYCFTLPCDIHDRCYGTCKADKADCDFEFFVNMASICDLKFSSYPGANAACYGRAFALYTMVTAFGGPLAYGPAQAAACVCDDPEFARLERVNQLRQRVRLMADVPLPEDVDADGLPDDWEQVHGFDPSQRNDTLEDADEDGLNNFQEFFHGLDPRRADSDADGRGDLVEATGISPPLERPGRFDQSWQLQANGQTTTGDVLGHFRIRNVSAPDVRGETPGSAPDFLSDDLVRIVAVQRGTAGNRYASSAFFRLRSGSTVRAPRLTITNVPPRAPESLRLVADAILLTALGDSTRLRVVATYADGSTEELNSPETGTTWRLSNPGVASLDANGKLTALRAGQVMVAASNQGATTTQGIDIVPESEVTQVRGLVQRSDGTPAVGVTVSLTGLAAAPVLTGADGRFAFVGVPTGLGDVSVIARVTTPAGRWFAVTRGLAPVPNGVTDAGSLRLAPVPAVPRFAAAGSGHALVTRRDGTLWCWGENDRGQVGDGSRTRRLTPVQVGTDTDWRALAAGPSHTLALQSDGSLWAWGEGTAGRLGLGDSQDRTAPTRVGLDHDWAAISAGESHNLALRTDGSLWAWGGNLFGQIGDGTTENRLSPVAILPEVGWQSVAAGRYHSLAVRDDGTLWAWGGNSNAQLGDGTRTTRNQPVQIGTATDWAWVTTGGFSSFALKTDGGLWAWGENGLAQLGLGHQANRTSPERVGADDDWWFISGSGGHVVGVKLDGSRWVWGSNGGAELAELPAGEFLIPTIAERTTAWQMAIAANLGGFSLGVDAAGSLWTWGDNRLGQLGTGTVGHDSLAPAPVGTNTWRAVAAGNYRSGGIATDGRLLGWGSSPVGDGSVDRRVFPTPLEVSEPARGLALSGHALLATAAGTLLGWGENFYGQVGHGQNRGLVFAPITILTNLLRDPPDGRGLAWHHTNLVRVAAGGGHSLAIDELGALWVWGWNAEGQLGLGNLEDRTSPGLNAHGHLTNLVVATAGGAFSVVLRGDGRLFAWGGNENGELGDGTANRRLAPVPVGEDSEWHVVAAGGNHVLALKEDGSLWGWGRNRENQLGDGTRTSRSQPAPVGADKDWIAIAAGYQHSLALKQDGSLWAWGRNAFGQLGDGTLNNRSLPTKIGGDLDWEVVAAGASHSLALKADGSLWAWGDNDAGELGTRRRYRVGDATNWGPPQP